MFLAGLYSLDYFCVLSKKKNTIIYLKSNVNN